MGSQEFSNHCGSQLVQVSKSTNDLFGTEDKQIPLHLEDISKRMEVNTYSKGFLRKLTESIEIHVNIDYLKH